MTQRPNGPPGSRTSGPDGAATPSPADIWQDWVTIWQSELNALATDREAQQAWARLVGLWAAQARAAGALLPVLAPKHDGAGRRAGAEPPAGAAPIASAPDAGDAERQRAELERLARRVEELERRLAGLDGDGRG